MAKAEIDFRAVASLEKERETEGQKKNKAGKERKRYKRTSGRIMQTMSSQNTTNLLENARRNVRVSLSRRTFAITPHDNDLH